MKYLILVVLSATCWSCHSSRKAVGTPAITVQMPDSLPPLPVSEIDIPLKVAGRPLLQIADTIVPREFTSEARLDQLKAMDKCVMSVFSMDMTQMIVDSIRSSINSFCGTLDQTLFSLDFAGYLHHSAISAWRRMPLGPYGYLITNPQSI